MVDMDFKLNTWKNRLLDLGKRNQLLNYRDSRLGNLRILSPGIFELWESFVIQEKSLTFPREAYGDEDTADIDTVSEYNELLPAGSQIALFNQDGAENQLALFEDTPNDNGDKLDLASVSGVVTNKPPKELQKVLRNIRGKAKTVMEEQGINVLYLAFGFLRWTEAPQSKVTIDSPLILVPVTLSWESIISPFVLSPHEDEIVLNPTLVYKMENDFGIKLPEFSTDISLSDYFSAVQDKIASQRWQVIPEVGLSLLSFLKINMYQDLERNRNTILQNPAIRALAGDSRAIDHGVSGLDNYDHDGCSSPLETFQVVDADSSQQDAILCAKQGFSFVLQGPPGTGKSQTITNIIAESLAAGKKVLFVSEKMAALEVVHKRLMEVGLSDFCLILHSHKANKKSTLEQLGTVLKLAGQKLTLTDEASQKLAQLTADRKKLNDYASQIYTVIEPLHKTIYDINGYIASLQDYRDAIFPIVNIRQTTPSRYNEYIRALSQLKNVLSKLRVDSRHNPWRGSTVKYITNDLRSEVSYRLDALIPQLPLINNLYDEIGRFLDLKLDPAYICWNENVSFLRQSSRLSHIPLAWLCNSESGFLRDEAERHEKAQREYRLSCERMAALHVKMSEDDPDVDFPSYARFDDTDCIDAYLNAISAYIGSRDHYMIWNTRKDKSSIRSLYSVLSDAVNEYANTVSTIQAEYERDIFSIDYNSMYIRFKSEYTSIFKSLNGKYRADKRLMQGLHRAASEKLTDDEIVAVLARLRRLDELKDGLAGIEGSLRSAFGSLYQGVGTDLAIINARGHAYSAMRECIDTLQSLRVIVVNESESSPRLSQDFGDMYQGLDTDWSAVLVALDTVLAYHHRFDHIALVNKPFLKRLVSSEDVLTMCEKYADKLESLHLAFAPGFDWFLGHFEPQSELRTLPPSQLEERLKECKNDIAALEEWIDISEAKSVCLDLGLKSYLDMIDSLDIKPDELVPVFQKRFFNLWLDQVLPEFPAVARFRHRDHEELIREFSRLDKTQLEIARIKIRSRLINSLPSLDHFTSGVDEVSILKRELGKQRRIKPIRVLFREIPNLILALKPCLMMSPLSVSLFLESDAFHFDTVIFDEASQVCTENAIGAISRGKQVIIAGDRHQLPPTGFFNTKVTEGDYDVDEDEEPDDSAGYESILDEAALFPNRELRWHYRSRHEHLIAYSNAKIYDNKLITFPSNVDRLTDVGVEYIHVPGGFYDRGGRRGNVMEAAKVAELVLDHFQRFPHRSLGVIAFGEVQQMAIETAIRKLRLENQQYEPFFHEDRAEAFFVKSLENVQGDERDTIIFSIGYAKDAAGVMRMNFGPLSQTGGERRLNVAMTRAKYNVKLVGSILPTDINTDKVSSEGTKLLRGYIEFAQNGPIVLQNEVTESETVSHDSPFEASVYSFLERHGYKLATQVGCSGYRIDMAVKHPSLSGRYVLGIECDGASYHSARTARERDRLRQDILESMGWRIYRIWSTDWIKDPVSEGKRLLDAVEKAIAQYTEAIPEPLSTSDADNVESDQFVKIEDRPTPGSPSNPYGFKSYALPDYRRLRPGKSGIIRLVDYVDYTVFVEHPIHYDLLCQRLAPYLGREKATSAVRQQIDIALISLVSRVKRNGDFLYHIARNDVPARQRGGRDIKFISPDELAEAMLLVLKTCIGTTRSGLIDETVRAYGFTRRGNNISVAMDAAYTVLLSSGKIRESDGKTFLSEDH